jgi:hypothetical protein
MEKIIEITRMAVKEQFRHLPLMELELNHLRTSDEDPETVYLLVDGPEYWQKKYIGSEDVSEDEENHIIVV